MEYENIQTRRTVQFDVKTPKKKSSNMKCPGAPIKKRKKEKGNIIK